MPRLGPVQGLVRYQSAHGGPLEAGLSFVQVRDRLDVTSDELAQRIADVAPVTVRKRSKMPSLVRRLRMNLDGSVVQKWTVGYLVDTIYLRYLWMHRIDAATHELDAVEFCRVLAGRAEGDGLLSTIVPF